MRTVGRIESSNAAKKEAPAPKKAEASKTVEETKEKKTQSKKTKDSFNI